MNILYGIPNCDTVKTARSWMETHGLAYTFHDFKKQGVPPQIERWIQEVGWERLLNRKGTSWRKLDPQTQSQVTDSASAARLMCAQPSLIKRPVVEWSDGRITVGFDPMLWQAPPERA